MGTCASWPHPSSGSCDGSAMIKSGLMWCLEDVAGILAEAALDAAARADALDLLQVVAAVRTGRPAEEEPLPLPARPSNTPSSSLLLSRSHIAIPTCGVPAAAQRLLCHDGVPELGDGVVHGRSGCRPTLASGRRGQGAGERTDRRDWKHSRRASPGRGPPCRRSPRGSPRPSCTASPGTSPAPQRECPPRRSPRTLQRTQHATSSRTHHVKGKSGTEGDTAAPFS